MWTVLMEPAVHTDETAVKKRKYTGPPKGSQEAKDRMARVRAAQWAKNGLIVSKPLTDDTRDH